MEQRKNKYPWCSHLFPFKTKIQTQQILHSNNRIQDDSFGDYCTAKYSSQASESIHVSKSPYSNVSKPHTHKKSLRKRQWKLDSNKAIFQLTTDNTHAKVHTHKKKWWTLLKLIIEWNSARLIKFQCKFSRCPAFKHKVGYKLRYKTRRVNTTIHSKLHPFSHQKVETNAKWTTKK